MSTSEERKVMDTKVDVIIPQCCNGNKYAERYLHDIAKVNRIIDDLYDKDVMVSKEDIELMVKIMFIGIPTNPFYINNYQAFVTQNVIISNAWMDSNKWEHDKDKTKRIYAEILKGYIGELLPLVAFLTSERDINKMREISLKTRELFLEEVQ